MVDINRKTVIAVVVFAGLAIVPPLAEATDYPALTTMFNRALIYALAAMGLDLIIGYGGMVSFGHAAFFGIGAYTAGILGHHAFDIHAFGDAVAMTTVGRGDAVMIFQMHHDANASGFLARIKVDETRDIAPAKIHMQTLLEFADRLHATIGFQKPFFFQWERVAHKVLPLSTELRELRFALHG